jgi:KipI family sensor histidine kinase inhibitor
LKVAENALLMYDEPLFLPAGDQALVVELGDAISPEINRRVHNLMLAIEDQEIAGVTDLVPTYRSLLVQYDPMQISYPELQGSIAEIEKSIGERSPKKPIVVYIPTLYSGEYAPDLAFVAEHAGLTPEDVVSVHSGADYLVYMLGFTPGFPYLGGLSEALATPRLSTPRMETPAGSVGIAESQTGIYPVASPGGWRIIGRTPLRLFDPEREPPSLLAAGDHVRFVPMSGEEEYLQVLELVEKGEYQVASETMP